jgi:hypothetical protein
MNPLFSRHVEEINYLLNKAASNRSFSTPKERIAWERGYLTGLLASLAYRDSDVHVAILRKIKEN